MQSAPPEKQLPYFDDYSWRVFLAMVWPAKAGDRGVPDPMLKPLGTQGPVVFQTLKALWEVLRPDKPGGQCCVAPTADWDHYEDATANACGMTASFGDVIMSSFSKYSDLGEAAFGTLTGPLEAQNQTYVRYLVGFNKPEFEQIKAQKLYLADNVKHVQFESGALDVKSAWLDMKNIAHPERYYRVMAWVQDPATGRCKERREMGLVGLHIVQKTPSRPRWIWTTFEHIDNVPPSEKGPAGAMAPYAFYRPGGEAAPKKNPLKIDPKHDPPVKWPPPKDPFNLERSAAHPIADSTHETNSRYRAALKDMDSVWQYYQLVMTQFPIAPQGNDGFPDLENPKTANVNLTMETFDQDIVPPHTCLGCHKSVEAVSDFVWALYSRTQGSTPLLQIMAREFKNVRKVSQKNRSKR